MDCEVLVGDYGPLLMKAEFLKHRDSVAAIREASARTEPSKDKPGRSNAGIAQEFNDGTGSGPSQIAPMMLELK